MTDQLTKFKEAGQRSNEEKKKRTESLFINRLLTSTSYIDHNGFMRVNSKHLGPGYWRPKQRLWERGLLQVDHNYKIGEFPQGYKIFWTNFDLDYYDGTIEQEEENLPDEYVGMDKIRINTGSQMAALESVTLKEEVKDCLNIDFFRQMIIDNMAPIKIEGDYIVLPHKKAKSFLFNFQNESGHIIDDKDDRRPFNAAGISGRDCFYFKNSRGREYCVVGDADLFIEATSNTMFTQAISFYNKIKHKRWYCHMNLSNGRTYHTTTNMPRWMRPYILIDGMETEDDDMANENPVSWHVQCLEDCASGLYDLWEGTDLEGKQDYETRVKLMREGMKRLTKLTGNTTENAHTLIVQHRERLTIQELILQSEIEEIKNKLNSLNHTENAHTLIVQHREEVEVIYFQGVPAFIVPKDFAKSEEAARKGYFYQYLADEGGCQDVDPKKATISVAYDVVKNNRANRFFKKAAPTLKRWVDWRKTQTSNKQFALDIQRRGAYGWDLATDTLYYKYGVKNLGTHDSTRRRKDQREIAHKVLNETLIETYWLGFTIKTK